MQLEFLKSATVLIRDGETEILCDPWLFDGVYYGSWAHYPPGVDCARCRDEAPDREDPDGGGVGSITPGYVSPDEYEANMEYYDHQHCLLYP